MPRRNPIVTETGEGMIEDRHLGVSIGLQFIDQLSHLI
jgi:hypothetical protein